MCVWFDTLHACTHLYILWYDAKFVHVTVLLGRHKLWKLWNVLTSNKTTYIFYSKFAQYYPIPNLFHVLTGGRHCCYFFFFFFFFVAATFFFSFGGRQTTFKRITAPGWSEVLLQPYSIRFLRNSVTVLTLSLPEQHITCRLTQQTELLFHSPPYFIFPTEHWDTFPSPDYRSRGHSATPYFTCSLTLSGVVTNSSLPPPPAHIIPNLLCIP